MTEMIGKKEREKEIKPGTRKKNRTKERINKFWT
jgi:hypothetical protein